MSINKYRLSLTSVPFAFLETVEVATVYVKTFDWDKCKKEVSKNT